MYNVPEMLGLGPGERPSIGHVEGLLGLMDVKEAEHKTQVARLEAELAEAQRELRRRDSWADTIEQWQGWFFELGEILGTEDFTRLAPLARQAKATNAALVAALDRLQWRTKRRGDARTDQQRIVWANCDRDIIDAALSDTAGERKALFQQGLFDLHSGGQTTWKIDCDALTEADLATVASLLSDRIGRYGSVEGVPSGGLRLAEAFRMYQTEGSPLIVDDVLTTGASMEEQRAGRDVIGAVIFARGRCPPWVTPLFTAGEGWKQAKGACNEHPDGCPEGSHRTNPCEQPQSRSQERRYRAQGWLPPEVREQVEKALERGANQLEIVQHRGYRHAGHYTEPSEGSCEDRDHEVEMELRATLDRLGGT